MMESENQPSDKHCLNCGAKLQGKFCHECGQKDIPQRQTLRELWDNFISSFWSYEGKFFSSVRYLITKPGYLAKAYNEGKRETFFHPARMYVFISFVFFLILASLPDTVEIDQDDEPSATESFKKGFKDGVEDGMAAADSAKMDSVFTALDTLTTANVNDSTKRIKKFKGKGWNIGMGDAEYKTYAQYDSVQALKPEGERDGWFSRRINYRVIDISNKYGDDGERFVKDFQQSFFDSFSKVFFFLLPFFALTLKLLYIRRGHYYSEHLVFSIYYYNFFYLAGSLQMLIGLIPVVGEWSSLIGWWIFFYLLVGMKRLYQQSWWKTIVKFLLFIFIFSVFVSIAFLIAIGIIFLVL